MFYPTRAQMDPGSIWLRNLVLGTGRGLDRTQAQGCGVRRFPHVHGARAATCAAAGHVMTMPDFEGIA